MNIQIEVRTISGPYESDETRKVRKILNILKMRFFEKRSKLIGRGQKFLDRFGDYAVIFGRFVPAIRPIAPFLIGLSDLRAIRFYRADIIACLLWGIALIFLVLSVGSIFK